ncbi:MAG: hypothetical protein NVSMB52_19860 [Chloroflexota bacterium]
MGLNAFSESSPTTYLYNVSRLLKSEVGQTRTYEFASDEPMDLDDSVASDIHGQVKFTLTNLGVIADVHASATLDLTCARCLEPGQSTISVQFQEEFQPEIDIATGLPSRTPRSEDAFSISQNHMVDLTEPLRQNLVLSIDLIPVCSRDCKGLCPTCGTNLNTETCACPPIKPPNPFEALQSLFSERQSN